MNCKTCQNVLPELLLEPGSAANAAVREHIASCAACAEEFASLQATFALLDEWDAPEISPYFDQKLAVRLREEQAAPPAGWFEKLRDRMQLGNHRELRPALAGALALALLIGGGSIGITRLTHSQSAQASATVNDLQILDKNAQALQQMDQIIQEDVTDDSGQAQPQS